MSQVVEEDRWKTIRAGRRGPRVSHLMFADNLLLFGEVTPTQMSCVMRILKKLCSMSGQQIN